ncbi:MAG: molybdopterin-guanine dinucleotide biosynthesis protein B [Clostridia bacterium]|nr:molybdopterin-guanine dinucleotide biosynthesis protein B [Clostridia bacterium]
MPPIIAISGAKNVGKTTFLTHLIPELRAMGLRVGVIKHDGHEFEPDVPGTDSHRLRTSGAECTAVYSAGRWMFIREAPPQAEEMLSLFRGMDVVLLEGGKHTAHPKIELLRGEISRDRVCGGPVIALCADFPVAAEVPVLPLDGYRQAARIVAVHISSHSKC